MNDKTIGALIGSVYTAADDPSHWPLFLEELSEALGSRLTAFIVKEARDGAANCTVKVRSDPESAALYDTYYASRNVFFIEAAKQRIPMSPGQVLLDNVIDERVLLHSEFYGDFLEPRGVRYSTGLVIANEGEVLSMLSTMRTKNRGPFDRPELAILHAISPHLRRAVQIHRRLRAAEERASVASDVLDSIDLGVVLIDSRGDIEFANASARRMLESIDGISVQGRRLHCSSADTERRLRTLMASALRFSCGGELTEAGGAMAAERPSGEMPYEILVAPATNKVPLFAARSRAFVLITDPSRATKSDHAILRVLYGLTEAESRVAERLLNGMSVEEIAVQLSVSRHTSRSQLRSIFEKTGTRRQSDLVRLLSRSVATLRR